MGLSPESEWVIVACGLIAHADGLLAGDECDRLLGLMGRELDGPEYSEWLALISDPEALRRRFDRLQTPPSHQHPALLEQAWAMAMVDGESCEQEVQVLDEIAARIGVDPVHLQQWRQAWLPGEHELCECAAMGASIVLAGRDAMAPEAASVFDGFVRELPTTNEHRRELSAYRAMQWELGDVGSKIGQLPDQKRDLLLQILAPAARASTSAACSRFVDLANAIGLPTRQAETLLYSRRR